MKPFRLKSAGHFVTVHIFPNLKAMHRWQLAYCKRTGHPYEADDGRAIALFMWYERIRFRDGKEERTPDLGKVLFCQEKMAHAIIAHELLHAAMQWERKVHRNGSLRFDAQIGTKEERLCGTLTELLAQFYDRVAITEHR